MNLTQEIFAWAQGLQPFQSDLLRRLCAASTLTQQDLDEVSNILLGSHGALPDGAIAPVARLIAEEDLPRAALTAGSVRITSLSDLQNINAIVAEQCLEFASTGLTVIYGNNGAGKSSYARVLKDACRATDRSEILPNVYEVAGQGLEKRVGKAVIHIEEGGATKVLERVANTGPSPELSSISVFDSGCATVYTDKANKLAYVPATLSLFNRLAEYQDELKIRIDKLIEEALSGMPAFTEIAATTEVRRVLDGITGRTSPKSIENLAKFSENDQARLDTLKQDLMLAAASDSTKTVDDLRRKSQGIKKLHQDLTIIGQGIAQERVAALKSAHLAWISAKTDAELLAQKASANSPIPSVGTVTWKALWHAALEFCNSITPPLEFPPSAGHDAVCPLCQQDLSHEARERFEHFQTLVEGAAEKHQAECLAAFNKLIVDFRSLPEIKMGDDSNMRVLFADAQPLEVLISTYVTVADARRLSIEEALAGKRGWDSIKHETEVPNQALLERVAGLEARVLELQALSKPEERVKAEAEVGELTARSQLAARLPDALRVIEIQKQVAALRKAQGDLKTAGITRKKTELTEGVVTDNLRACLTREIQQFSLDHLKVKMDSYGSKGTTYSELKLDAASNPGMRSVLSEGEQRALTLAFFLAEIGSADHDGGIILDDPVSSLDHERRDYVADRLVEEAKRRQVIVFTHDLVFLMGLVKRAEAAEITCREFLVKRSHGSVGIAVGDTPWRAMSSSKRAGYLRNRLQSNLKKVSDPDDYRELAKTWISLLRDSWERAVEEMLFGDVVQRYRASVETNRLKNAKVDETLKGMVNAGMSECSKWVHDQAAAINVDPPRPDGLDAMLKSYEEFLTLCK